MASQRREAVPNNGYISIKWDSHKKKFQVGGDWTDKDGRRFDLGFVSLVRRSAVPDAVKLVAEELGHAMAGNGVESTYRPGGNRGEQR